MELKRNYGESRKRPKDLFQEIIFNKGEQADCSYEPLAIEGSTRNMMLWTSSDRYSLSRSFNESSMN